MKTFIKPAVAGQKVRMESGVFLPDEGADVERTIYWERRLNDGSVVIVEPVKTRVSKNQDGEIL